MMPANPAPPLDQVIPDLTDRLLDTYLFCDADTTQKERFTVVAEQALDIVEEWGWIYIEPRAVTRKQVTAERELNERIGTIIADLVGVPATRIADVEGLGAAARKAVSEATK